MTPPPAAPASPAAPNPIATLTAGLSQPELMMLAGGAAIVLLDIVTWFVSGYGVVHVILAGAMLAVVLTLFHQRLAGALGATQGKLLLLIAIVVGLFGARQLVLDVLRFLRPPIGVDPFGLLGMVVTAAGCAAIAYGGWLMWRRSH